MIPKNIIVAKFSLNNLHKFKQLLTALVGDITHIIIEFPSFKEFL